MSRPSPALRTALTGWLDEQWPYAIRLGHRLTGSRRGAVDLLLATLVRHRHDLGRLVGKDDLDAESALRAALAAEYVAGKGIADHDHDLSREQWATLVLTEHCHLTQSETATVLDRPSAVITTLHTAGLESLGGKDNLHDQLAAYVDVADTDHDQQVSPSTSVTALIDRFTRAARERTQRRRLIVFAATSGLVLTLIVAIGIPWWLDRQPGETRAAGEWISLLQLDPDLVSTNGDHYLTPTQEVRGVGVPDPESGSPCYVSAASGPQGLANMFPDQWEEVMEASEHIRYRGRDARRWKPDGETDGLIWQYAPNEWAFVGCSVTSGLNPISVADQVKFVRQPVLLPFAISNTTGRRIAFVGPINGPVKGSSQPDWLGVRLTDLSDRPDDPVDGGGFDVDLGFTSNDPTLLMKRTEPINGLDTYWSSSDQYGTESLCLRSGKHFFCLSASTVSYDDTPISNQPPLRRIAQGLRLADPDDRSTWFDARDALPSD